MGKAQLKVDTFQTTQYLVENVLLGKGVEVHNVKFTGSKHSIGLFVSDSTRLDIEKGILLTTGRVFDSKGPNRLPQTSGVMQTLGDADLSSIAKGTTFDAAILEFDFVTNSSLLTFNFVFASEEYVEFVNSQYNDVFAFFVSGPGITGKKNIAVLPGTDIPITINNINDLTNSDFYIDNSYWDRDNGFSKDKMDSLVGGDYPYTIEFDGMTRSLEASLPVIPNKMYHIKIEIADVGDMGLDSGVFLEAESFSSKPDPNQTELIDDTQSTDNTASGVDPNSANDNPATDSNDNAFPDASERIIYFDYDKYEFTSNERKKLDELAAWLEGNPTINVQLNGHTDSRASDAYNQTLSENRNESVRTYLVSKGVAAERIKTKAYSEKKPRSSNSSDKGRALNRRVEITVVK